MCIDKKELIKELMNHLLEYKEDDVAIGINVVKEIIENFPQIDRWFPCNQPPNNDREVLIFNGKSYSVGYYDGKTWVNAIHPLKWKDIIR